jgi:outer membrane lipoprotein-sorting protein
MKNAIRITLAMAVLGLLSPAALSAEPSGLEVMTKVYERPTGTDQESDLTMTLIHRSGSERIRKIHQFLKDFGDVEKKIMFFKAPADVRNTSFMNWSYDDGRDDDQWIYLPALKKVKRISSDSKSDYFMGSDFTYDDLGDRHPTKDKHRVLREEKFDGESCYVVESTPKDAEYMYSRTVTWVIKDKWIGLKREFHDEDEDPLKILRVKSFENIGGFWVIVHSEMHNTQKNHRTVMKLENVRVDKGVSKSQFTERMMKRGL